MSNSKPRQHAERRSDIAELSSTWGHLIDEGLREARATLIELDSPAHAHARASGDTAAGESREAWLLIGRAFHSSASALRALAD